MGNFNYILILLSSSVVLISLFHRLHLPPIIGYLFVGMLVGPGGMRWLPSIEDMHILAEFGVVFLMFTLGLEFSIPKLMCAKKTFLGVGGLQVLLCAIVGALGSLALDFNLKQSLIIGGALALSSTAVVIKQLDEQKEQRTPHGELTINILLFQDIAAVLFLVLISALADNDANTLPMTFLLTIIKGVGVIVIMAMVGLWILRPLFHEVAKTHSTELFMIATLLVALSAGGITYYLGLSMALGSFLAGLVLGETEFKRQIDLDIRPFRDVLLGLFFVIIGAYLELNKLPTDWAQILIILISLIFIKTLLIMLVTTLFGKFAKDVAFKTSIILAHGGEFSFVVLKEAIDNNIILPYQRSAIFAAVVISIMLTPLLIRYNQKIVDFLFKKPKKDLSQEIMAQKLTEHAADLKNHVILCGFGRVGQVLARFLEREHIPWLALDLDPLRISKSSIAGEHSFYGDARHPKTLAAAGLAKARMVAISFSNESSALDVLKHVRAMRLDLPVFVRLRNEANIEEFQKAGATEVVPESLEGSIMLASHLLLTLGVSPTKIIAKIKKIHSSRYEIIRGIFTGADEPNILENNHSERCSLHSIVISEGAAIIGNTVKDLINGYPNISIKALIRENKRYDDPKFNMVLKPGDVIVIFATPEETTHMEDKCLRGA